jgi:hypothetical protein
MKTSWAFIISILGAIAGFKVSLGFMNIILSLLKISWSIPLSIILYTIAQMIAFFLGIIFYENLLENSFGEFEFKWKSIFLVLILAIIASILQLWFIDTWVKTLSLFFNNFFWYIYIFIFTTIGIIWNNFIGD